MKNAFGRLKDFSRTRQGRLASTYLAIIMAMTIIFSTVVFSITSVQFNRPVRPDEVIFQNPLLTRDQIRDLLDRRADEQRLGLIMWFVGLNLMMLVFGAWFSLFLARKTLEPIERAMAEQVQFVSDASHELRTPLTALQSMNEVFLRRKKITDAQARELAEHNVEEVRKLDELTVSLLGLVRADRSETEAVDTSISEVIGDAMAVVVAKAQAKNVTVDDDATDVVVRAIPTKLGQVIRILLDNAVKYSKPDGHVSVWTEVKDTLVRVHVSDDGIGIAKENLPHIFSRFYRADDSRSKEQTDGYGLGLAIAKTISDHNKMNIMVASELGKGSTFSIDLPLARNTNTKEKQHGHAK